MNLTTEVQDFNHNYWLTGEKTIKDKNGKVLYVKFLEKSISVLILKCT